MALTAPANWSTATTGTTSTGPASTATIGRSMWACCNASAASKSGAITRIPSTPWIRSRSIASVTDGRLSALRLATIMK